MAAVDPTPLVRPARSASTFEKIAAPLALAGITIGVFWKILLTRQYTWLNAPDFAYQVAPWFQMQAAAWHHWHFPLWDPYLLGGQSLVGQAQPGAMYPPNWLLFLAPLHDGLIAQRSLHIYFALIHFMGALFCYLLCRDLKRSRTASVLGASAFAFAGWMATTGWPQMLNGAVWAPLVLMFALRVFRGESPLRHALASGACLGVSFLSGHHQIPLFMTVAVCGLWLYQIARPQPMAARVRNAALLAALLLMAFLAGAAQILPAYSYGRDAVRWVGAKEPIGWSQAVPYSVHSEFGLRPDSVLGFVIPGIYTNSNPFVGITVVALALCGFAWGWRSVMVRLLGAMALGGLLLSFANYTLLHGLVYALLPGFDKARDPAMAEFVCHLPLCVLAAFGVDGLAGHAASVRRAAVPLMVFGAGLLAFICGVDLLKLTNVGLPGRLALTALAALGLAAVMIALKRNAIRPGAASVLVVLLALGEFGSLAGANWPNRERQGWPMWDAVHRDRVIFWFLGSHKPWRAELNDQDIPYNFGDWYGLDTLSGYVASMPARTLATLGNPRAKAVYGVKYFVARNPPRPDLKQVGYDPATGIRIFEASDALPRVRTVHRWMPVANHVDGSAYFDNPAIDLTQTAFGFGPDPALQDCAGDRVRLQRYEAEFVVIDADMGCRGMVILGDAWSKNWTATVDGRAALVYPAYDIVRGVAVDAGRHRIVLRYRPAPVYWGVALSLLSLAGLAIVYPEGVWRRVKRKLSRR
jgi:hypothetical protein